MEIFSCWWFFCHRLHWKSSKWQLIVRPVLNFVKMMTIMSVIISLPVFFKILIQDIPPLLTQEVNYGFFLWVHIRVYGRPIFTNPITVMERSSGWQHLYSLETLKTSFKISSEYQGCHPDHRKSCQGASPDIHWRRWRQASMSPMSIKAFLFLWCVYSIVLHWTMSMALRKTVVTPLLTQWSYCSLLPCHRCYNEIQLYSLVQHWYIEPQTHIMLTTKSAMFRWRFSGYFVNHFLSR